MQSTLLILLIAIAAHSALANRCVYFDQVGEGYTCRLEDALHENPNAGFVIQGVHLQGRTNADVRVLFTFNSVLRIIPLQIFDQFPNLQQILIHNAGLQELNAPWRNCGSLTTIRFSNNVLPALPRGIFEYCNNVRTLTLTNSTVQQIDPLAFNSLYSLERLEITQNSVMFLHPDTFEPLQNLTTLMLQNNQLNRLHPRTLTPLRSLSTINLNGNQIERIESATFLNLPLLRTIQLDNNPDLYEIEPFAFAVLPNVDSLSLRGNAITTLNSGSFLTLPTLRTINIRDNNLRKIERDFFKNFPGLESIDLRENECVNSWKRLSSEREDEFKDYLEGCFERFENPDQTTTTTTGASSITLSFALLLSAFVLAKLSM